MLEASADAFTSTDVYEKSLIPGGAKIRIAGIGYDARDRMISVTAPGGSATYGYGTDNLRVRVSDSQGDRRILLDGMEELAEHPTAGGAASARFDHDPTRIDAVLAQTTSGGRTNAVADALGSVYAMTSATGAVTAQYSFDAYGARTASTETTPTAWGFTGRRHDPAGEMYYRARYYGSGAGAGAFTSVDPRRLQDPNGNAYWYATDRPTLMRDPSGEFIIAPEGASLTFHGPVSIAGGTTDPNYTLEWRGVPTEWQNDLLNADTILRVVTSMPWCNSAFRECGRGLTAKEINDAAYVYWWTNDPAGVETYGYAGRGSSGGTHAYFNIGFTSNAIRINDREFGPGRFFLAFTLLHEFAHHAGATDGGTYDPDKIATACMRPFGVIPSAK